MTIARRLLRDVTPSECPWLPRTYKEGETLYAWRGPTYGSCTENGTAMSEKPEQSPFIEIPYNALGPSLTVVPDIPEPVKCGAGRGEECCIFLTCGPDGFCCERGGSLHHMLVAKQPTMGAKRIPKEPYPECMKF